MKEYLLTLCFLFLFSVSFSQDEGEMEDEIPQEQKDTIDLDDIDFDDVDLDEIEEDELSKESSFPWNKFAVGGQIGQLQFGDVTNFDIAPEIVFNVSDKVAFGVDGIYQLTRINRLFNGFQFIETDYKTGNLGGRLFTRVKPVESFPIFAQVEYERLDQEYAYAQVFQGNTVVFPTVNQSVGNANAGLGFNNGPYYLALMYNFMHSDNEDEFFDVAEADAAIRNIPPPNRDNNRIYPLNAVSFRTGINIPLGQGNKNKKRDKNKKKKDKEEPSREN